MLNKEIRELLPERLRGLVERVVLKEEKLQEIRIRREKGIALRYDGRFRESADSHCMLLRGR